MAVVMRDPLPYRPSEPSPFRAVKAAAITTAASGAMMILGVCIYAKYGHNPLAFLPMAMGWVLFLAGLLWYLGIRRTEG